jgi:hypothetical protein
LALEVLKNPNSYVLAVCPFPMCYYYGMKRLEGKYDNICYAKKTLMVPQHWRRLEPMSDEQIVLLSKQKNTNLTQSAQVGLEIALKRIAN